MKNFTKVAIATLLATSFGAAAVETEGSVTFATNYLDRGITLTDDSPAIQGTYDLSWSNGIYAGVFASSVEPGAEIQIYGGYAHTFSPDVTVSLGLNKYIYTDDDALVDQILEYNFAINTPIKELDNVGFEIDYADEDEIEYTAYAVTFQEELVAYGVTVYGEFGRTEYKEPVSMYDYEYTNEYNVKHLQVGVAKEVSKDFVLAVEYNDTDTYGLADEEVLAKLTYNF